MRNFEEIKAEVFRRSENRIKERKRNSLRALIVCVPLCLMLTFLPSILPESDKNLSTGGTDVNGDVKLYVEVEALGASVDLQSSAFYDTSKDVTQFYYLIDSAFVSQDEMDIKPGAQEDNLSNKESAPLREFSHSLSSYYKITFKTDKDTQAVYILNGYTLTNDISKQKITLSEEQRLKILNELGLVLTLEEP